MWLQAAHFIIFFFPEKIPVFRGHFYNGNLRDVFVAELSADDVSVPGYKLRTDENIHPVIFPKPGLGQTLAWEKEKLGCDKQ